jgi:sugar/nucleoside kinase (ribokinase family)
MAGTAPIKSLSLGGASWNTMVYVDQFPEPRPGTVFTKGYHETVGSSGAGKALNMQHLGADATLFALLGDDDHAARIRKFIESRGITLIAGTDPAGTVRHVNLMNPEGDRISLFANAGSHELEVDVEPVLPAMQRADIVSVTILNYCRQFLPVLRDLGKKVAVDIHDYDGANPHHIEFIEAADFLFMSSLKLQEWRSFLETRVAAGTTLAVCTHGSAGASGLAAATGWTDIPAVQVARVVDTNGAGDAFYAGFMTSWFNNRDMEHAMQAGAETAAAAVQSPDLAPLQ